MKEEESNEPNDANGLWKRALCAGGGECYALKDRILRFTKLSIGCLGPAAGFFLNGNCAELIAFDASDLADDSILRINQKTYSATP